MYFEFESKLATFSEILDEGCFYCGTTQPSQTIILQDIEYEHDHCIDICLGDDSAVKE